MKNLHRKNPSEKQVIKREPGKLNCFHAGKNQLRLNSDRFKQNGFKRIERATKQDQKPDPFDSAFEKDKSEKEPKILQKNWWIHLWSGLVLDREGKHHRLLRQAIWLYLYLLLVANRQTGFLYRHIPTILAETGFNRRSIARWQKLLRDAGYIKTRSTGRALYISISKWKPISQRKTGKENR